MADLERDLSRLAEEVDWPATPDLAGGVARRLATAPRPRRRAGRRLLVALAVLVLAVPSAAFAFPDARDDVLEWLGLKSVVVERRPVLPPTRDPQLGARLPLAAAARRAGLVALVPPQLDGAAAYETGGRLSLRGHGLLLEQRRGGLDAALLRKVVAVAGDVQRVTVGGRPGLWFSRLHAYLWVTPGGAYREQPPIRSGPALVWERGGRVLRLEGRRLTKARALAIARAARPRTGSPRRP